MIKKQVEARLSGSEELTDDDLADIAGGSFRSFLESIVQALGTLDTTPLGSKPVRRRW